MYSLVRQKPDSQVLSGYRLFLYRITVVVAGGVRLFFPFVINHSPAPVHVPDRLYRLLFILALVICQFSLVLHQQDIERHSDNQQCSICLAFQSPDHALSSSFIPPHIGATNENPAVLIVDYPTSRTPIRLVARSPPVPALYA